MAAGLILFVTLLQIFVSADLPRRTHGRLAYDEAIGRLGKRYALAVIGIDQLTQYANAHGKPVGEPIMKLLVPQNPAACAEGQIFRTTGEDLTVLFLGKSVTETVMTLETVRKRSKPSSCSSEVEIASGKSSEEPRRPDHAIKHSPSP